MTEADRQKPADLDPAEAARTIEDAGVADETAAYTDAIAEQPDEPAAEPEAHPS